MTIHEGFLELAAAAIDFELEPEERAELDRHLAGCDSCRRTAAAYRDDAAAIAHRPGPRLESGQSMAILAAALRPPKSGPPVRLLAIAALVAVVGAGVLAVGMGLIRQPEKRTVAVEPSPSSSASVQPSGESSPPPSGPPGSAQPPGTTPRPGGSPTAGLLPVRGSGQELGTMVRMAPGAANDLYISIPQTNGTGLKTGGTVLTRLDASGETAPGWPIRLPGASFCGLLLAVGDGSIRIVCYADDLPVPELGDPNVRAFAFDADGRSLAGWPVELPCCFSGRMRGDDLIVAARHYLGDVVEEGQPAWSASVLAVAANGAIRTGVQVPFEGDCCSDPWVVGPDGVAYGTVYHWTDTSVTSELYAVGLDGISAGFPVTIDGNASLPAFDAADQIHVTVASLEGPQPSSRTLVFDREGRPVPVGSGQLNFLASSAWWGAGGESPAAPLVGTDGTTFVIGTESGTTVAGLSPNGQGLTGWPYRSDLGLQDAGFCGPGETGCGGYRAEPVVGSDNVLYLIHAAAKSTAGGSLVALGQEGRVVNGWPVGLKRPGSAFWSVVVSPDSTSYVLAIEPEPNGSHSATILAIAPDSTVLYNVTIVEP